MNPLYIVLTTGGKLYATVHRSDALAIATGKVYKIGGLIGPKGNPKQLTTLSGAGSPYTITDVAGVVQVGAYITGGDVENQ